MGQREWAAAVAAALGLLIGSFLNVVATRVPREESIVGPRSRCPHCGLALRPLELVPLLSFLWLRGRCRRCAVPIGWRYPLVEAGTALLFGAVGLRFGFSPEAAFYASFVALLVAATAIDLEHHIIPNELIAWGFVIGAALWLWARPLPLATALWGVLAGGGIMLVIALVRPDGMGGGDVKLAAMNGMYLGLSGALVGLFFAFVGGALIGVALILSGLKRRRDPIAFGPFLACGAVVALFWGDRLVTWWWGR